MLILGIESSCDETAAAVVEGGKNGVDVLSNVVSSQIEIHKKYGGVVPEVAAREHVLNILPVVNEALEKAGINYDFAKGDMQNLPLRRGAMRIPPTPLAKGGNANIDAIAVSVGPGLITSLIVGVEAARVLSYVWDVPVIGINHIEGHIYANFIESDIGKRQSLWETLPGQTGVNSKFQIPNSKQIQNSNLKTQKDAVFPAIVLTVSGGHTMIVLMKNHGKFETVGETRDDAAGEAFDKAAKLLNIGYPGGPAIAMQAERFMKQSLKISNFKFLISNPPALTSRWKFKKKYYTNCAINIFNTRNSQGEVGRGQIPNTKSQNLNKSKIQNPKFKISLPRPMINSKDFDFSFSGLKTALLYEIRKDKDYKQRIPEYCCEFQQAVVDVLVHKTIKAARKYGAKTVMLAGGVSANKELRRQMEAAVRNQIPNSQFKIPDLQYTTDNAAMIASAGCWRAVRKDFTPWRKLRVDANLELKTQKQRIIDK